MFWNLDMKAGGIVKFTISCKRKVWFSAQCSASELPETLVKTAPIIYVRFHGKNGWYQHNYPDSELKDWSEKIKEKNAQRVLCYFNNDFNANAVKNCLSLKKFLEENGVKKTLSFFKASQLPVWRCLVHFLFF